MHLQVVEIENRIGDIRSRLGHLLLSQDVAPCQLHETAALCQAGQARVDEAFAGQAVQNDIDPGAACRVEDFPAERGRAAVEHLLDTVRAEVGSLARARRGEHFRARRLG